MRILAKAVALTVDMLHLRTLGTPPTRHSPLGSSGEAPQSHDRTALGPMS